jgi:hydroxypyruvate reductase
MSGADVFVAGGETTVRVTGRGRGGRNQEMVLGAVSDLDGGLFAAVGTDGVDGASDAAGGFVDAAVIEAARASGRSVAQALADNDADRWLEAGGGRVVTGPTGTNVADLCVFVR